MAYLDHAGAAKPSRRQLIAVCENLMRSNFSNPHSKHQSAKYTAAVVDRIRSRILRHFNVSSDTHAVIFTSGATEALKIVAESFDFGECKEKCVLRSGIPDSSRSIFVYMKDAHTSVVGMRELVQNRCSSVCVVNFEELLHLKPEADLAEEATSHDLFAVTAMSNFCGRKYSLDVVEKIHNWRRGHAFVCLDAAAWVSTSGLDLSQCKADFLVLSFYKLSFFRMFGLPTGIGALISRRDSSYLLRKHYFGGGTVKLLIPDEFTVFHKADLSERFENGTLNYWSIAELEHGFDDLDSFGGMAEIQRKTYDLSCQLREILKQKHKNGAPLARIYEEQENAPSDTQGPIVTFNLLRDDGSYIGYAEVDKMCCLYDIELRTGCFCNQGACQEYLQISPEDRLLNFKNGKECGDSRDLHDGKPLGAIRVSFGRQSTIDDVKLFERMLLSCFFSERNFSQTRSLSTQGTPTLTQISLFPVKSCTAFTPARWALSSTGLKYDRCWMITSQDGVYLSLKTAPQLHLIEPEIDSNKLILRSRLEEAANASVPLDPLQKSSTEELRVCSDRVETVDCGDEAAEWISDMLNMDGCRLRRKVDTEIARVCSLQGSSKPPIGLSNEAPYLLINKESTAHLASVAGLSTEEAIKRFRANFVIDGIEAFSEDKIFRLKIGDVSFMVVGKCQRCQIICVDPETGEKDPSIMLALRDHRMGSNMTFGIYLQHSQGSEEKILEVGMAVDITWQ